MSPFRRFLDFISYPSHSRTMGLLAFLIILLAIPLTVNIAQKQQELRQRAESCTYRPSFCTTEDGKECHPAGYYDSADTPCTPVQIPNIGGPKSSNCMSEAECITRKGNPVQDITTCGDVIFRCDFSTGLLCSSFQGRCEIGEIGGCTSGKSIPEGVCSGKEEVCCQPTPAPPSGAGGATCDATSPGVWEYACNCTVNGSPGHHATRVCTNGSRWTDPTCYPGTNFTVDGVNYVNCVAQTGGAGVGGPQSCPSSGDALNPESGKSFAWGGKCDAGNKKYINAPGTNKCYYESCEQFNNGPSCWFNSGIGNPIDCPNPSPQISCPVTATCPSPYQPFKIPGTSNFWACQSPTGTFPNFSPTCVIPPSGATPPTTGGCTLTCPAITGCVLTGGICQQTISGGPGCGTPICSGTSGQLSISFASGVLLHGIGGIGDIKNPRKSISQAPNHPQKTFTVGLYRNATDRTPAFTGAGDLSYQPTGAFTGTVNITAPAGSYFVRINAPGYIKKFVTQTGQAQLITLAAGQPFPAPTITLPSGDLNNDGKIDALDFNSFLGCYNQSPTGSCAVADLDDDGVIGLFDFNLLRREFDQVED